MVGRYPFWVPPLLFSFPPVSAKCTYFQMRVDLHSLVWAMLHEGGSEGGLNEDKKCLGLIEPFRFGAEATDAEVAILESLKRFTTDSYKDKLRPILGLAILEVGAFREVPRFFAAGLVLPLPLSELPLPASSRPPAA
jgi:hypothetical protein